MASTTRVRRISADDRTSWEELFSGYAAFYGRTAGDAQREALWRMLLDPQTEVYGAVACDPAGTVLGIAHFRPFVRPLDGSTGMFLDDLFVAPTARKAGTGRALLAYLAETAQAEGYSVVRWITDTDNATARRLYDDVATETRWVTYDMPPAGPGPSAG